MPNERPLTPAKALLFGTLAVAILDGLDAVIFFGLRGVQPMRIFQGIASGLLGKAAFEGGVGTVVLGLSLHVFIASSIVTTFSLVSRRFPALAQRPFLYGPLYGLLVYLIMTQIVLPLSAVAPQHRSLPVIINGVLIHLVGVGLPAALAARAATASVPSPQSS
ncbi:MAG TPA: hypothetical protein VLB12_12455 [Gemmatimonadales bacterium]|nr:hypothetical protein [Gemmatimonadales bacterium]